MSDDKATKDLIANNMIVNLNELSVLMKGGFIHKENSGLIIIVH